MKNAIHLQAMLALITPAVTGCGLADSSTSGSGLDSADRPLVIQFDTLYTVGTIDGEEWETFGEVNRVAFDSTGRLHVFDRQNARIVVVSSDGSFVRQVGRPGGGPGELQRAVDMAVTPGGTIAIVDFAVPGFLLFDAHGEFTREVRLTSDRGLTLTGMVMHPDGDAVILRDFGGIQSGESGLPPTIPIRKVSLETGDEIVVHEAWRPPPPEDPAESEVQGRTGSGMHLRVRVSAQVAFSPLVHVAILPDGRYLVVDSTTYSIDVLGSDGGVRATLRRPAEPIPVTEAIREREKDRWRASFQKAMASLPGGVSGEMAAQLEETQQRQLDMLTFADVIPVIDGLAADWSGHIWVERATAEPGEPGPIDIIDAEGRYYGTIEPDGPDIPDAFGPDGLVAYIETDEYDVPRVRVLRLRPFNQP